jgi:hypothetical protein
MAVSFKENNCFFVTDQTPRPYPTRSLPAQFNNLLCMSRIRDEDPTPAAEESQIYESVGNADPPPETRRTAKATHRQGTYDALMA